MNLEARVDRLERRLDATLKMVHAGMKMLVKMQEETRRERKENREFKIDTQHKINALIEAQMRSEESITELTAAQKRTDSKLDRLIDSLARNRSNGHSR
jgi:hypothetical protein